MDAGASTEFLTRSASKGGGMGREWDVGRR
jgi:hypothetical protein